MPAHSIKTKLTRGDGSVWIVAVPAAELDGLKDKWEHAKTHIRFIHSIPSIDIKVSHDAKKWVLYKTIKGTRES